MTHERLSRMAARVAARPDPSLVPELTELMADSWDLVLEEGLVAECVRGAVEHGSWTLEADGLEVDLSVRDGVLRATSPGLPSISLDLGSGPPARSASDGPEEAPLSGLAARLEPVVSSAPSTSDVIRALSEIVRSYGDEEGASVLASMADRFWEHEETTL